MAAVVNDPTIHPLLARNYVLTKLDVQETGEAKTRLENPGAVDVMKQYGGEKSGLPFYVILDSSGKKLADSDVMSGNGNIGYPGAPDEITRFVALLKRTGPNWTQEDLDVIRQYLVKHSPEPQPPTKA